MSTETQEKAYVEEKEGRAIVVFKGKHYGFGHDVGVAQAVADDFNNGTQKPVQYDADEDYYKDR